MSAYPYDDAVLREVAGLLYDALPAMYRVPDEPPAGAGDLKQFVEILAVPLAMLRQSIQELQSDLFIDTADDRMIPALAEMVGLRLVFPDAVSNRRDVRGAVSWRRRKGTPSALRDMGTELAGRPVVVQEGWKLLQITQDLDLPRLGRVLPDLRPALVAEQVEGPLDQVHHLADPRPISARSGRYHQDQVAHWLGRTTSYPLVGGTPVERTRTGSDLRFAMAPTGEQRPLPARIEPSADGRAVDRVPPRHFAAAPERWFGRTGGFQIEICGVAAGVAGATPHDRVASTAVGDPVLQRGAATLTVLDLPSRGWRGDAVVTFGGAPVAPAVAPATGWVPDLTAFVARAQTVVGAVGVVSSGPAGPELTDAHAPVLRVSAAAGSVASYFPGAVLELATAAPDSTLASTDRGLAVDGGLRGAVHVRIPAMRLSTDRYFHVAADGSLYAAGTVAAPDAMPEVTPGGARTLRPSALVATAPGPVWPVAPPRAEPRFLTRVAGAPGRGPAVLHGGRPLSSLLGGVGTAKTFALTFAVQEATTTGARFRPFRRVEWAGPDPSSATWTAVGPDGASLRSVALHAGNDAAIAALRDVDHCLAVRFETDRTDTTVLPPAEVAWTTDDGRTVLIHLPELRATGAAPIATWPAAESLPRQSEPVRVGEDGSTWDWRATDLLRSSYGDVAPIAGAAALRRRTVAARRLCPWNREDWTAVPPRTLAFTAPGRLDVDPAHGLFAMSASEPPQQWPASSAAAGGPPVPPPVTASFEEGATVHVGALPAPREPELDARLPRPTRLITRNGTLHAGAPADWHAIPRYPTLSAALADVAADWQALTAGDVTPGDLVAEVIQFEDSATYPAETPSWPAVPPVVTAADAQVAVTIQAAEHERPTLLIAAAGWTGGAAAGTYAELVLLGLAIGGGGWTGMTLPAAHATRIAFCTVLEATATLTFPAAGQDATVIVDRCATAGLVHAGPGVLEIRDSIIDARPSTAISAPAGLVDVERSSVGGQVSVRAVELSESIVDGLVVVDDRFRGCARYSRVGTGSVLPRQHRVVVGVPVRVVSTNRRHAAWWRLAASCDAAIVRGGAHGSEMGAFAGAQFEQRLAAFRQRIAEFTPAGLTSGIIRED